MAGGDVEAPFPLTGWKKHFNSYTIIGRRNVVLATYGTCLVGYLYYRRRSKQKRAIAEAAEKTEIAST